MFGCGGSGDSAGPSPQVPANNQQPSSNACLQPTLSGKTNLEIAAAFAKWAVDCSPLEKDITFE